MSEFIGARISLISKSDIKYVGTLHEINSETSTVALENVKSFGTEGRRGKPNEEIPPSDQIYEYIVFRGSDVKDLTIIEQPQESKEPQMPNDPAILGSARPPQQGGPQNGPPGHPQGSNQQWRGPPPPQDFPPYGGYPQQQSRFAPPGGPHGFPGAPGAVPGYGPGPGPNFGGPGGPPPPGWYPPPGHGFPQGPHGGPPTPGGPGNFQQQQGQQFPPGGPSPLQENQRPGPKQGPQGQGQSSQAPPLPTESKPTELSATPAGSAADSKGPPLPKDTKPEAKPPTEPKGAKPPAGPRNTKVAVPLSARPNASAPKAPAPTQPSSAAQSTQNATQAAAAAVAAAMAKLGSVQGKPAGQSAGGPTPGDTVETLAQKISNLNTSDSYGRGGYRGGAPARGGRGGRGDRVDRADRGDRRGGPPRQGIEIPTSDFDFESSNAKFNKQDLVKQAIATGSPVATPDESKDGANGTIGPAKHDDDDVVIPGAEAKKYDKGTSFFDNLSSELRDRQAAENEGKRLGGSEFRSEERKRNMETFGESSAFRGRGGGYRGRGFGNRGGGRGQGRGRGGYAPRGDHEAAA